MALRRKRFDEVGLPFPSSTAKDVLEGPVRAATPDLVSLWPALPMAEKADWTGQTTVFVCATKAKGCESG